MSFCPFAHFHESVFSKVIKQNGFYFFPRTKNRSVLCLHSNCDLNTVFLNLLPLGQHTLAPPCALERSFLQPVAGLCRAECSGTVRDRLCDARRKNPRLSKWVSLQPRLNVPAEWRGDNCAVFEIDRDLFCKAFLKNNTNSSTR